MFRLLPAVVNTISWITKCAEEQGNIGRFRVYSVNLKPLLEKDIKKFKDNSFERRLAQGIMDLLEIGGIKNIHQVTVEIFITVKEKVPDEEG